MEEVAVRTPYQPYGTGIYRREVSVRMPSAGVAIGEVIDDFHHFRATIHHDAAQVLEVLGEALRHPWSTCAGAVTPLGRLEDMALAQAGSLRAASRHTSWRAQCTHLFDAAAIAIARTARRAGPVTYRMAVPDRVHDETRIEIERDGRPLLAWNVDGPRITAPQAFAGQLLLGGGFADWAESSLDADLAEAVLLLHRAAIIASGRAIDLEAVDRADHVVPQAPLGRCHTYTPGTVEQAWRVRGSARNLTHVADIRSASQTPQAREQRSAARAST